MGTLARLGLAAVWLVSGALKISDPGQTYIAVQAFDVLPDGLVRPVAIGMPLVELALGLFLLAGFVTRWVSVLSVLLLAVLIAAIAQSWARGLSIDCGCFGGGGQIAADQTKYPQEIARDLGFALLGVWLIVRPRTWVSVDGWLGNSQAPADDHYVDIAEGNE
ncbi:MauE/DoxX family redox-associated membrane protein [Amycolatopsis sp. cmx-4-54]|uniref:MauE/DoxX family redox-associated membrane protein n=1 Tax=Amycolatopsis sp. cmx-4-54 TaxID=2790936 RepID=UPI00397D672C